MTYPKPKKQQLLPTKNNCRLPRISTKEKQSPLNFILMLRKWPYLNPEMHFPNHRNPLIFVIAKLPKVSYPAWGSTGSLVLRAACSWDAHNFCWNETGCKRWKCRDGCEEFFFVEVFLFGLLFVVLSMFNMLNECLKYVVDHHDFWRWIFKDLISSIIIQSRSLNMTRLRRHRDE